MLDVTVEETIIRYRCYEVRNRDDGGLSEGVNTLGVGEKSNKSY